MAISERFGDAADEAKDNLADKEERDKRIDQAGDAIDPKTDSRAAEKTNRPARKGGDRAQNRNNNNNSNRNNNNR